jgi:acyl carrier protein
MERLINLIKKSFDLDSDIDLDTPLISSGLIDSLRVVLLLSVLEKEYGRRISTREIGTDNFDTPRQMKKLLESHK